MTRVLGIPFGSMSLSRSDIELALSVSAEVVGEWESVGPKIDGESVACAQHVLPIECPGAWFRACLI